MSAAGLATRSRLATAPSRSRLVLPPELAGGLPILGHALEFNRNPVRFLLRARKRHGDIFSFLLAGSRVAVLTGPRANEAFFRASDDQLSARDAYQFTVPIFGKDIAYATSPQRMSEQLDLITPALSERRLRAYVEFMIEEVENYVGRWGNEGTIDLVTVGNELTVFIASRCLIGREFRQNLSEEFAHLYHDMEGCLNLLGFFWPNLPLPAFRRRDRARVRMVEIISRIIAERRAGGIEGEDFLQTLMSARYADGSGLSDDNITGLLLTLIFAGQHTSAVLAAWTGVELLLHPAYLARIMAEQERVLGAGELTFDALRELTCLERGVKETERLHPPLILLMRKVLSEFTYKKFRVPAGWLAMVSPAVSHRLAEVFSDPDRFDPDRFAPGREEERKARFSLITFGGGRHACIGQTFAYLQVKTLWTVILRRFELELIDADPEPNYATLVVGPKQPCRIRYRRKERAFRARELPPEREPSLSTTTR
jgi:sterol 14-demethylase